MRASLVWRAALIAAVISLSACLPSLPPPPDTALATSSTAASPAAPPSPQPSPSRDAGIVEIGMGWYHTCAARGDGSVWCWGQNASGQLGDGTTTNRSTPAPVAGLSDAVDVVGGGNFSCALVADGTVWCWGSGDFGQLGDRGDVAFNPVSDDWSTTAHKVEGLDDATAITAGGSHVCVIRAGGTVACWGYNGYGNLGVGTFDSIAAPIGVPNEANVVALDSGRTTTCAVHGNGTVACWGGVKLGGVDTGTTRSQEPLPYAVLGVANAVDVSVGDHYACALISDSSVTCWGENGRGQLGDGGTIGRTTPAKVAGLDGVTALSAGSDRVCTVRQSGSVWCWGYDVDLAVAGGAPRNLLVPTVVWEDESAVTVAAGVLRTCIIDAARRLHCWGYNSDGQLGDGTTADRAEPVAVVGLD